MNIGKFQIGKRGVFIVAELSANHNNSFDLAVRSIKAMAKSGADAVKIQTFTADSLSLDVNNKYFGPIKDGLWKGHRPYDLYEEAAMPWEWQPKLKKIAEELGMVFFSSPFDFEAVDFLEKMNVPMYKIASFEINDIPLIEYVAKKKKPIIMSVGIADLGDIKLAVDTCRKAGNSDITLLKCTSQYPSTVEKANLLTIPDLRKRFKTRVGVSDHTLGSIVPTVAVALGAKVVEKHFTLDRKLGGPDSAFSMEPDEFAQMVKAVRQAEASLGGVNYEVSKKDLMRRRSLFAVRDIAKGAVITEESVRSVRPGFGLAPKHIKKVIGKKTKWSIKKGEPLNQRFVDLAD